MKKILFVATVTRKHIDQFHLPYIKWFKDLGFEVDVASKNDYDGERNPNAYLYNHINIDFDRNPFSKKNIKALFHLKRIIRTNNYLLIHTHTPVASIISRIANMGSKVPILYTAHGFQFAKKGPLKDWIYYPVEKTMSRFTDTLITINDEDYQLAKKKFKSKRIYLVPGVGVDLSEFNGDDRSFDNIKEKVKLIYVAEFINRKNHNLIIDVSKELKNMGVNHEILLPGDGPNRLDILKKIDEFDLPIICPGYVKNIPHLLKKSHILISTSYREGLPVNIMEAMACGLPVITTDARGSRDLVSKVDKKLVTKFDAIEIAKTIQILVNDTGAMLEYSNKSLMISKEFEINRVMAYYEEIYNIYL